MMPTLNQFMPRKQLTILNILITATILFAWGHSLMPGDLSEEESSRALELLRPFLEIFFGKGNVTDHLVRKLAHFSEYALLGCELSLRQQLLRAAQTAPAARVSAAMPAPAMAPILTSTSTLGGPAAPTTVPTPVANTAAFIPWFMRPLRILIPCLAVCFIDETIQLFVPGRGGRVEDMWIDMAGALTGLLFGLLFGVIFRKRRRPSSPA